MAVALSTAGQWSSAAGGQLALTMPPVPADPLVPPAHGTDQLVYGGPPAASYQTEHCSQQPQSQPANDPRCLYVGNLPFVSKPRTADPNKTPYLEPDMK